MLLVLINLQAWEHIELWSWKSLGCWIQERIKPVRFHFFLCAVGSELYMLGRGLNHQHIVNLWVRLSGVNGMFLYIVSFVLGLLLESSSLFRFLDPLIFLHSGSREGLGRILPYNLTFSSYQLGKKKKKKNHKYHYIYSLLICLLLTGLHLAVTMEQLWSILAALESCDFLNLQVQHWGGRRVGAIKSSTAATIVLYMVWFVWIILSIFELVEVLGRLEEWMYE